MLRSATWLQASLCTSTLHVQQLGPSQPAETLDLMPHLHVPRHDNEVDAQLLQDRVYLGLLGRLARSIARGHGNVAELNAKGGCDVGEVGVVADDDGQLTVQLPSLMPAGQQER